MSALRLIKEETISSSVTSVNITDVFTADFDVYKVIFSGKKANISGTGNAFTYIRGINSSGSIITSSNYWYTNAYQKSNDNFNFGAIIGQNSAQLSLLGGVSNDESEEQVMYVTDPFSTSRPTFFLNESVGTIQDTSGNPHLRANHSMGGLKSFDRVAGLNFFDSGSDEIDSGIIRVFGLRVDT
jgi:hypothetical protein